MPEKLKVYVYYEDEKDSKKNMKLKIVIPQKWKTEPMSKITSLFVEEYNKKHLKTDKIQLDHCRITKKIGPPLDSKIVQDCVEKYDDLYVRTKVQTVTKEKIDDETLDGYESDWSDSMDHDPVRYAQWYRKQHRKEEIERQERIDKCRKDIMDALTNDDMSKVYGIIDWEAYRKRESGEEEECSENVLCFACGRGYVDVVKLLIEKGADVNEQEWYHPLYWAMIYGRSLECVKILANNGSRIDPNNISDPERKPALFELVDMSEYEDDKPKNLPIKMAEVLIRHGEEVDDYVGDDESTVLTYALYQDNIKFAKYLIGQGANVDGVYDYKRDCYKTPLFFAVANKAGDTSIMNLLLQLGADADIKTEEYWSPLHNLALHGSKKGHIAMAKRLIHEYNMRIEYGFLEETPLHCAALGGNNEFARFLIQQGADVNARTNETKFSKLYKPVDGFDDDYSRPFPDLTKVTPVDLAIYSGAFETMKLLIQNGAKLDVDAQYGTALHLLINNVYKRAWYQNKNNLNIATYLVLYGVDVNGLDKGGNTALHCACKSSSSSSIRLILCLVCLGAKVDENALKNDRWNVLNPIHLRMERIRKRECVTGHLYAKEEKEFIREIAFLFALKYSAAAFKPFMALRSFITYNGIFMALGFERGRNTIWNADKKLNEFKSLNRDDDGKWDDVFRDPKSRY